MIKKYDIVIIGGGPAGLAAAISARKNGIESTLILERDKELGGILNQCIHNGFGLHTFGEELTGPEYADRFIRQVREQNIEYKLNTMVINISREKVITAMNREEGLFLIQAKAGREGVILGSGDIGLIMARRMTLEGAKVKVVAELMPYSGGLKRNIVQCLDDFGIPLKLSHTVVNIKGKERVEGVTLAQVGADGKPIPGTEEEYACDTLLLSVGLIPENELSREMGVELNRVTSGPVVNESLETNIEGVFACGNVHDLVDFVSEEAAAAGKNAADYIKWQQPVEVPEQKQNRTIILESRNGVRYTVPVVIRPERMPEEMTVRFRVGAVYKNCYISCYFDEERVLHKKRTILAPGEMEQIKLTKEQILNASSLRKISILIEEE